jgi:SAM-dependent methyltransferase
MDKEKYYQSYDVASVYDRMRFNSRAGAWTHQAETQWIRNAFSSSSRLIELACGTGRLLKAIAAAGYAVTGVDQSAEMLAAGDLTPAQAVVGDVRHLPFPDASFDGAYTFRFTNHVPNLEPTFREAFRVLRPGGGFLFDTMRWSPLLWDSPSLGGRNYPVADRDIRRLLETTGFDLVESRPLFPIGPYLLSRLPAVVARTASRFWPGPWFAVKVWHARKRS